MLHPPAAVLSGKDLIEWLRGRLRHPAAAVFVKELIESLRDRRTLIVALLLPVVMMPVVTLGIPYLAEHQAAELADRPAKVAVVGENYAPQLVALGRKQRLIDPVQVPRPLTSLRAREVDAILEIPPDFSHRLAGGTASVVITYDESATVSRLARERLQRLIASYSVAVTESRLRQRGLSQHDLAPIDVSEHNVATRNRLGGVLLAGILPFFIAVWAVLGGQYAALDLGAGEKERRTLETLLVAPPSRWALAVGKFAAITAASMAAVVVVIAMTLITLRLGARLGLAGLQRGEVTIGAGPALLIALFALLLVAFLSALQLALSIFARSVREAQQYFTPIYLAFSLPALAAQFLEGWQRSAWTYLVPGLNAVFTFRGLLLGETRPSYLLLTAASLALCTAGALWLSGWLLQEEPVIFRA